MPVNIDHTGSATDGLPHELAVATGQALWRVMQHCDSAHPGALCLVLCLILPRATGTGFPRHIPGTRPTAFGAKLKPTWGPTAFPHERSVTPKHSGAGMGIEGHSIAGGSVRVAWHLVLSPRISTD